MENPRSKINHKYFHVKINLTFIFTIIIINIGLKNDAV